MSKKNPKENSIKSRDSVSHIKDTSTVGMLGEIESVLNETVPEASLSDALASFYGESSSSLSDNLEKILKFYSEGFNHLVSDPAFKSMTKGACYIHDRLSEFVEWDESQSDHVANALSKATQYTGYNIWFAAAADSFTDEYEIIEGSPLTKIVDKAIQLLTEKDEDEQPANLQHGSLQKHVIPNTKVFWKANELINPGGLVDVKVFETKNNSVYTRVMIDCNEEDWTEDDVQIESMFASFWEAGTSFTLQQACQFLDGDMEGKTKTAERQNQVYELMRQHRQKYFTIDATDEMRKRKILDENGDPITFKHRNTMIDFSETLIGDNVYFTLTREPMHYMYARVTGQLLKIPQNIYEVRDVITHTDKESGKEIVELGNTLANSDERRRIKSYLSRRVSTIKYDQRNAQVEFSKYKSKQKKKNDPVIYDLNHFRSLKSDTILYDRIYEASGVNMERRASLKACRDYTKAVLDYWVFKGWIDGYEEVKEGRKIKGVQLTWGDKKRLN